MGVALVVALVPLGAWSAMFTGRVDPSKLWVKDAEAYASFFSPRELNKYFYPREHLNANQNVPFYVVESDEVRDLKRLCMGAKVSTDDTMLNLMSESPWRTQNKHSARFYYLPTFAGLVLGNMCAEGAKDKLKQLFQNVFEWKEWTDSHGHAFITFSSTEHVQKYQMARTHEIYANAFQYNKEDFAKKNPPDEFLDYAQAQTISLERFYRPSMQYCQLFHPLLTQNDPLRKVTPEDTKFPSIFDYNRDRPKKLAMVEFVDADDPRFEARKIALRKFSVEHADENVMVAASTKPNATDWKACDQDLDSYCTVEESKLRSYRESAYNRSRFALITRGEFPHEEQLYQAIATNTLIITTVDKAFDGALPFGCQVPWEDFTIRISSADFLEDPVGSVKQALLGKTENDLDRMLKLQFYFRPDLLLNPNHGQPNRLVENIMHNALRRCSTEQQNAPLGFTATRTMCPFTDWAKPNLLNRLMHNVDLPPWKDH